ncbi:MAG: HAD family hydrolase [Cyclobacteriaceae bacterium]|nr:HAD family hydrolase [Cyclobacteriaceae bacterium]
MELKTSEIKKAVEQIRKKNGFICDMDGVIYHGNKILPGVKEFIEWLQREKKRFLFLTNSSERTQPELQDKLARMGILVDKEHFYTSALATASFLNSQKPKGSAYVIGEAGLFNALYDVGYRMNNVDPDYVVMGEARSYSYEKIEQAVNLVIRGAKLIGTNPDLTDSMGKDIAPGTGSLIAPIELATGVKAYFLGKPNPLMMRHGRKILGCSRKETAIVGDRMDTDIIAGIHSSIDTVLVLSGVTTQKDLKKFPYHPRYILSGVGDIPDS